MLVVGAAALLQAQLAGSPGQISGTVVGDDGKPLVGVFVTYTRSSASPNDSVPPSGGTATGVAGAYSFNSLIPATYKLCPNAPPNSGLIMTCAWALRPPVIVLQAGQHVSGNTIVMHKGTVLRIRVADPKNLVPVTDWMRGPTNLVTGVWTADGLFHRAHLRSGGNGNLEFVMAVPSQITLQPYIAGANLAIDAGSGAPVSPQGVSASLKTAAIGSEQVLSYRITGVTTPQPGRR
jgi:hypothetical protein